MIFHRVIENVINKKRKYGVKFYMLVMFPQIITFCLYQDTICQDYFFSSCFHIEKLK